MILKKILASIFMGIVFTLVASMADMPININSVAHAQDVYACTKDDIIDIYVMDETINVENSNCFSVTTKWLTPPSRIGAGGTGLVKYYYTVYSDGTWSYRTKQSGNKENPVHNGDFTHKILSVCLKYFE